MADRDQHPSRDDVTRRAVFDQVDLQTAELEIVGSIYDGFAAAIVVTGQPRTVALTREYGDAVQLMALIERGRTALFALPGDGASLADHVYCPPGFSCPPIAEAASKPQGCGAIYAAAYDSIRKGAPGLSDATCAVIARSINMKAALSAQPQARDEAQPSAGRGHRHTALMDALHSDLMRQFPGSVTEEDGNSFIIIETPRPFLTVDVSALADHPAPGALRVGVEKIRAEINAPLSGPTHGAWDRGRIAGLKEALAALQTGGDPA